MRLILILLSTALICDVTFAARHTQVKSKSKAAHSAHAKKSKKIAKHKSKAKKHVAKKMSESERKALAKKQVEKARKIAAERKRREEAQNVASVPKMNVIASPISLADNRPVQEIEKVESEAARDEIYSVRQVSTVSEDEPAEITDFADFEDEEF